MTGLSVRGVYARMPPGAGVLVVKINFYYIAGKVGGQAGQTTAARELFWVTVTMWLVQLAATKEVQHFTNLIQLSCTTVLQVGVVKRPFALAFTVARRCVMPHACHLHRLPAPQSHVHSHELFEQCY